MVTKPTPDQEHLFPGQQHVYFLWVTLALVYSRRLWFLITRELRLPMVLLVWSLVSAAVNHSLSSIRLTAILAVLTTGAYLVYRQVDPLRIQPVLSLLGIMVAAQAALAVGMFHWWDNRIVLLGRFVLEQAVMGWPRRAGGLVQQPNLLGTLCFFGLIALFAAYPRTPRFWAKLGAVGLQGVIAYGLYISRSRAALVAVLTAAVVVAVLPLIRQLKQRNVSTRSLIYGALAIVVLGTPVLWYLRAYWIQWLVDVLFQGRGTLTARNILWQRTLELFLAHPWFGVGLGNSTALIDFAGLNPHNLYLGIAAELGWIGSVLVVLTFLRYIGKAARVVVSADSVHDVVLGLVMAGLLAGTMIHQLFEFQFLQVSPLHLYVTMLFAFVATLDSGENGKVTSNRVDRAE